MKNHQQDAAWLSARQPQEIVRHIRARLAGIQPRRLGDQHTGEAAVLMPVFMRQGAPHLLLTLRTEEVQTHKGQISFPGGMREGAESLQQTALRETFEEVGIRPEQIEILGRFHDYLSVTDSRVVPFAGFIDKPFTANPQASEVAEVLFVPLSIFLDPSRLRTERMPHRGAMRDVYFYSYDKHQIWGLTARIIKDFLAEMN